MDDKLIKNAKTLLKEKGSIKLDLSNPLHDDYFLKTHGGKEFLKDKYSSVYQAYKKTKEKHQQKNARNAKTGMRMLSAAPTSAVSEAIVSDISAGVSIPEIIKNPEIDKAFIKNDAYINVNHNIKYVAMDGAMFNPTTQYSYGVFYNEFEEQDIKISEYSCKDAITQRFDKNSVQEVETYCNFDYLDYQGNLNSIIRSSEAVFEEGGSTPIEKIEVLAPRSNKTPPNNPILITYKGRACQNFDYDYPENEPSRGQIRTIMPIEGYIIFKKEYKPVALSQKRTRPIVLSYQEELSVNYGYTLQEISKFFSIDKNNPQRVNFKFEKDWRVSLPADKYKAELKTLLSVPLFYKTTKDGRIKDIPFCIVSMKGLEEKEYYVSTDNFNVYVPEIKFIWGCFGKDTMIQMADHTEKRISAIKQGEEILTEDGETVSVQNVVTGTEKSMVYIETEDDRHILLTSDHPILTKRGIVTAGKVHIEDEMIMKDRKAVKIRYLYMKEYNDTIYNLDLGSSHLVIANGFVTGDFAMQNEQIEKAKESGTSEEVKELIKDLKMLRRELKDMEMAKQS